MNNDVKGIIRGIVGYSKRIDKYNEQVAVVELELKPIGIDKLRKMFRIEHDATDPNMMDPYDINEEQAKILQLYIKNGVIDLQKYDYTLECWQDPEYDWSTGIPVKINRNQKHEH